MWNFLAIYFYLYIQWWSFPMSIFCRIFDFFNSCCSNSNQQGTRRYRISNLLIMLDRWFGFRKNRNPTAPYSYFKYKNKSVITFRYILTLFHYLDNHQQPLWQILRWLHHDHIELEPSFQHSSSFHLYIQRSLMCI